MKRSWLLSGSVSLILLGGMWVFPTQVHALPMYSPISFYNYSLVDTVTANAGKSSGTKTQTLSGATPQSGTVSISNTTSRSSITATVNPQEIPMANPPAVYSNPHPDTSIAPSFSITQTLNYRPPAGRGSNLASAISIFSADFKGTGNLATISVNYFPGLLCCESGTFADSGFSSGVALTVSNVHTGTDVAFFYAGNSLGGMANTNFTGGAGSPPFPGFLPGPFFLDFATQSGVTYNISGDIRTINGSSRNYVGGTDSATFQLVANTPEPSAIALFGTGILLMGMMGLRNLKGRLTRT